MSFFIKNLVKLPILKRIIPSLLKKYIFFFNDYQKKIFVNNIHYELDLRHFIDRRFFLHRTYEEELFTPLSEIIKRYHADFFFDVGSCWGIYSLRFSNIYNKLNILAFDPIKKNIDRLNNSIIKNNISNIKTFHTAIGRSEGFVELGATEDYSPNFEINEIKAVIKEKSKLNFLDNMFEFKNKFLAFKIDTEGFEYEVLVGAKKLLNNNNCILQVEVKNKNLQNVVNFLNSLNYIQISDNINNKTDFFFSNFVKEKIKV